MIWGSGAEFDIGLVDPIEILVTRLFRKPLPAAIRSDIKQLRRIQLRSKSTKRMAATMKKR